VRNVGSLKWHISHIAPAPATTTTTATGKTTTEFIYAETELLYPIFNFRCI